MSKIPQGEWNAIAARYQSGESLSGIARSYGCTPSAIHYILKRIRQAPAGILGKPSISATPASVSADLVRANTNDSGITATSSGNRSEAGRPAPRGTVSTPRNAPAVELRGEGPTSIAARSALVRTPASEAASNAQPPAQPIWQATAASQPTFSGLRDTGPAPSRHDITPPVVLPGLDAALRLRADAAIALFRSSFDAALTEGSPGARERLRQAARDLMRVAARTIIVLDRLNAAKERSARGYDYPRSAHARDDFSPDPPGGNHE